MSGPMRVDRPACMMLRLVIVGMRMDERRAQTRGLQRQRQRDGNHLAHDALIVRDPNHAVKSSRRRPVRMVEPHALVLRYRAGSVTTG